LAITGAVAESLPTRVEFSGDYLGAERAVRAVSD
jgi:hypothetical protein